MKNGLKSWLACLLAVVATPVGWSVEDPGDAPQRFRAAVEKIQARHYAEAIPILEKLRTENPDGASIVYNLANAYAEVERYEDALGCWQQMRKLEPGNWQDTANVVQVLQTLGRAQERDQVMAELLAEQKENRDPKLARIPGFCREKFKVDGRRVLAVEYFAPKPPLAVYIAFLVENSEGKEVGRYSLGSYDDTTQVARDLKEIGPTEQLYHLDYYERRGDGQYHRPFGFFKSRPDYATLRERVVKAMAGDLKPVPASATPAQSTAEKK